MLQMNVREGYRITTLEVVKLIEDLISYLIVAKYTQLRNAQIPKVFYEAASSSVVSNRSIALITDKFSVALLTKPAILNNANIALVDAVHYSIQKLEENYFKVRAQHLKYDVIDTLMITLIKDDDDLLGTVNSYIKSRRLRARCKTEAADSRYAKASRRRTKKDKDLEDSDTSSDVLRLHRRDRAAASQLKKTRDEEELAKLDSLLDSNDYCLDSSLDINSKDNLEDEEATTAKDLLTDAYILYFKELLSNNSGIFANAIGIAEGNVIEHNAVNDNNKLCSTKGERTFYCADPLALQFCFFSNSSPENISRLTKEEVIEMRINTTDAIFKALAAANKLFVIVYSFRKVDKHVFRAYNTISVTAQRTIIRKGGSYIEKRAILLSSHGKLISSIKSDFLPYFQSCLCLDFLSTVQNAEQQCRDILEKEGLNKSEASRRMIFNCFKMQAIAFYPALTTLKAAQFKTYSSCKVKRFTLNSVKDLFTNLSKDYFLVREARAITKSSLNIAAEDAAKAANTLLPLKEVCAKILIGSYKLIVQAIIVALIAFAEAITLIEATHVVIIELQDSIIYFNLDSELELKVLSKQDVKITS
ncbi:hypothetical protein HBI51_236790 [Parastagonospora nodorum]|nr:hypothetical protein HBI51_236790 [Parastagonospora nodorum]